MVNSIRWTENKSSSKNNYTDAPPGTSTWNQSKSTANYFNAPPGTSVWFNAKPQLPDDKKDKTDLVKDLIKIATNNEFLESAPAYQSTSFDEMVSFIALTGSEILQNTRSYDLSTNSQSLNKNIMDAATIRESFSPQNIIKLQETSKDYFDKYIYNLANHSFSVDNSTGIATISMPQTSIRKEYKVEIQTLAPKSIENGTIYN